MYKIHLILKYLFRRRIAWVALAAVMLCTTMVLVVISVMGGWLEMFKYSFHGLSGDVVVRTDSLAGFRYYQDMIRNIDALPNVKAAVPVIVTYGLISVDEDVEGVQVTGYPIGQIGQVNNFPDSLYLQHEKTLDEINALPASAPAAERERLQKMLAMPPSFDLLDESFVFCPPPPVMITTDDAGVVLDVPKDLAGLLRYDALRKRLVFKGVMDQSERSALEKMPGGGDWKKQIDQLYDLSNGPGIMPYQALVPMATNDVTRLPGMIVGAGVAGIHPDQSGKIVGRAESIYQHPVRLTMLGIDSGQVDIKDKSQPVFWIVDDSRTKVWQYDNRMVYVPFDVLQRDLHMDGGGFETNMITGKQQPIPARTSEIDISVTPGADLNAVRDAVQKAVHATLVQKFGGEFVSPDEPRAETWLELQAMWIGAIEHEKLLTVFLFGIISIVAIFLIFCIFYMIAVEKTRDIGIIKSVGATSTGVAGIFLGYGATIGIIGGFMGLLLSYLIVHNINWLHMELGKHLGIVIWNPEVYMFDKIPNTMATNNILVIVGVAIVSSIIGALIPAIHAARLNPVDALRFE